MKNLAKYVIALAFLGIVAACGKQETVNEVITPSLTTIFQGTFVDGAHPTSGSVKLAKDAAGKKYLVFENFKTDSGPDLRVYLSEDSKASNFSEIASKVNNGTFQLEVNSSVDTDKKKKVLIWCKAFSVNFGSADLK
jgi:hypothetical protein